MNYKNIKYKETDKIATISLDRPKFLNALSNELMDEIGDVLEKISNNAYLV